MNCSRVENGTSRSPKQASFLKMQGRSLHLVAAMTVDGLVTFQVKQSLYTQKQDVLKRLEASGSTDRYAAMMPLVIPIWMLFTQCGSVPVDALCD
ncbi:hypothetical protein PHET_08327 [Paragonimus heterotremus]|uniref:Uncharacterized protein n=1 Tax=Paragonimus heterotremus TaxID=100268 RepID=A0A8J4WFI6_9TREM|nr:hypothetical protein PHET_08327 [Paragonimus heterotremus]